MQHLDRYCNPESNPIETKKHETDTNDDISRISHFSNVFRFSRIIQKDVEKQEKMDHKSPFSGYIKDNL